jgi:hypothetical protein
LSIEGGIPGNQQRLVCPNCGKVFFAWRPDDLPGQKVKCYFCKHEFADEAALRPPPPAPIAAAPEPPAQPAATVEAVAPAAPVGEPTELAATAEPTEPAAPAVPAAEEPPAEAGS